MSERRTRARRRALRAAQVVTLGLALAGCSDSHTVGDASADAVVSDAGFDAGFDASECTDAPTTRECCELQVGGYWDEMEGMCFIAVPGPFVPPRLV